jgi:hypothetical protein
MVAGTGRQGHCEGIMTRMWLTILAASLTVGFCIMAIELFFRWLARFCRRMFGV